MTNSFDRPLGSTPVERRTSVTGLSAAMREVRIRLARDDIHSALGPVSRHTEAARLSLEIDDDVGLEHHLRRAVDDVRRAAQKHRELRTLLAAAPSAATTQEPAA
jgi:hypothetical protein